MLQNFTKAAPVVFPRTITTFLLIFKMNTIAKCQFNKKTAHHLSTLFDYMLANPNSGTGDKSHADMTSSAARIKD
jgi:hypothetical protein